MSTKMAISPTIFHFNLNPPPHQHIPSEEHDNHSQESHLESQESHGTEKPKPHPSHLRPEFRAQYSRLPFSRVAYLKSGYASVPHFDSGVQTRSVVSQLL
eukprot:GHVP01066471.1.p1 GENE.GHVP01066471.1~~GHVP01066471.1.p1  ORF type:complete len:100 (+),score=9.64 GHVP01066471.1:316-615(+)